MSVARSLSAFVPHDLTAPLSGGGAGPLAGLSAAVKDMYDIAGYRTGGGNPDWLDAQAPATSTAAAVVRILEAGATIIGKTICDEFFYSVSGANAHYGTPINPRAPDRLQTGPESSDASARSFSIAHERRPRSKTWLFWRMHSSKRIKTSRRCY